MTRKTLWDCTQCQYLAECDAHITCGAHKHQKGPDPCTLVVIPRPGKI